MDKVGGWRNFPGEKLVSKVSFEINGNVIDEIDGTLLNLRVEFQTQQRRSKNIQFVSRILSTSKHRGKAACAVTRFVNSRIYDKNLMGLILGYT